MATGTTTAAPASDVPAGGYGGYGGYGGGYGGNTAGGYEGYGHHHHRLPGAPRNPGKLFADPAPLGLMGFGVTTLVLSVFNCGAVKIPNLILGLAFFYGGLAQLLAGMWEFASGNTFGATAFSSYAAFWLSFAYIYVPQSGILAAYMGGPGGEAELRRALGLYLLGWLIFTVVMFFATWRSTIGLVLLLGFLSLTFFFLMIAEFTNNYGCKVTGGVLGVITACIAIYDAMHVLITHETSHFRIPNKNLSKKNVMEGTAGTTGTAGAAGNPPMKGTAAAGQDIANVA